MRNKVLFLPSSFLPILVFFYIGYCFTFLFQGYFEGTDAEFYIYYLQNPSFDLRFEPLFSALSFSVGLFFDGQSAYYILGLISLTIKAFFLSKFLATKQNKIIIGLLFV